MIGTGSASARRPSRATSRGGSPRRAGSSSSRWGAAARRSRRPCSCGRRSTPSSSSRARAGMPPPTTSRRRSSPACRPSAAAAAAAGSRAPSRSRTSRKGSRWPSRSSPSSCCSTGAARRCPPVEADRRVLVTSAAQPVDVAAGYLNAYRARIADLVLVTMAEPDAPHAELAAAVREHVRAGVPVIRCRPAPAAARAGRGRAGRVLLHRAAGTARGPGGPPRGGARCARRRSSRGASPTGRALRDELAGVDADVFVVELKAAAVDVVVEEAARRGVRVVVAANDVVPLHGRAARSTSSSSGSPRRRRAASRRRSR